MFNKLIEKAKKLAYNTWERIKKFFKDSEVIFLARLSTLGGAVLGGLYGVDWEKILNLDFSNGVNQGLLLEAGKWIVIGVIVEYARRRRATDL